MKQSFGTVVFKGNKVALRRVSSDFGGARWTFAKGGANKGETAEAAAARETLEETGFVVALGAKIGTFAGTTSETTYWLATMTADTGSYGSESCDVRFVNFDIARALIATSPSAVVVERDLKVLAAAIAAR